MLRESEAGGAWTTAKVYKENWLATRERYCDLCAKRVERCQRRVKVRAHVHEAVQCDLVLGGERAVGRMCIAAAEIGATHFEHSRLDLGVRNSEPTVRKLRRTRLQGLED